MRVSGSVSGEHNFTIVLPGRFLVILNALFADEGELLRYQAREFLAALADWLHLLILVLSNHIVVLI